jgi:hypothetical protein
MEQKVTTPVVKGLILSLILIVFGVALHLTGQSMNKGINSLQYIIIIGGIIWACISYAKQMNHNVTFGNVFAHGFKTTSVVTVIMVIYTVLAITVLFPEMKQMAMDQATAEMEKGNMPEEQMEQAISITQKFFVPFAIGGVLLAFMFLGCISSLIGAAVAKKNPRDPFVQG